MMFLRNLYYEFHRVIPSMVCKQIISMGTKQTENYKTTGFEEAKTGHGSTKTKPGHRKSKVCWIQEQWLFNMILPYVDEANERAGWYWKWDQCESAQFTQYEVGGYYNWHMDGQSDVDGAYKEVGKDGKEISPNWQGKVRKLSVTLTLNDNYEGGEFEILSDPYHDEKTDTMTQETRTPDIKSPGSLIVFPGFLHHRVAPVTKGVRHSVVLWCLGPPFV